MGQAAGVSAVFYCPVTDKPGLKKRSYLRAVLCGILFLLQDTAGLEAVWLQEMADTLQGPDNKGCHSNARKIRQAAVWLDYCTKDVYAGISAKDDRQRVAK